MYINPYYREPLEKILETGDVSRIEVTRSEMYSMHKDLVTFLIPLKGMERADCIVYGAYYSDLSCFADMREQETELVEKIAATIKYFLHLASTSAKREKIADSTIQALLAWRQAYKACRDAQKEYDQQAEPSGELLAGVSIAQANLEEARKTIQAQVEDEDVEWQELMSDNE